MSKRAARSEGDRSVHERRAILEAYVGADRAGRMALLKIHGVPAGTMAQWSRRYLGKGLRKLDAAKPLPKLRPPTKASAADSIREELELLRNLVDLGRRRGAFDDILRALRG